MTAAPDAVAPPDRVAIVGRDGRFSGSAVLGGVLLGAGLAALTLGVLSRDNPPPQAIFWVLLADLAYFVVLFGLISWRVLALIAARRRAAAGARLHLRLTGIFALVAIAPTVIVAGFAAVSLSFGLEAWFSGTVGSVVNNALITAEAYEREHRRSINGGVLNMANAMNRFAALGEPPNPGELLRSQQAVHGFAEAYLIDGAQTLLHRGDFSYTFTYEPPGEHAMARARLGEVVVLEDKENNELRALVYLNNYVDTFLYVTRRIDGDILLLLDETADTVALYNQAERSRERLLSVFALLYLGFALLVVAAAIWLGLWFAERLSRPIGALAGVAERVGAGDFSARAPVADSGDEVALLGLVFNRMTRQVKEQRDELVEAHADAEDRRGFIETLLGGVSAGVIGLDEAGRIEMANAAAEAMLSAPLPPGGVLADIAPGAAIVLEAAREAPAGAASDHMRATIGGAEREFLVRVSSRAEGGGYVVTLDDLTALVAAQREAAWGDVARRIAHEIKNPLTPIQLSAERLRRKYAPADEEGRAAFDRYADVIIRQAGDIRRMVDEFSRFARMPSPEAATVDLAAILRDAVLLQRTAHPGVAFEVEAPARAMARLDGGMIGQALTNLLKNAAEAVAERIEAGDDRPGVVRATLTAAGGRLRVIIEDNGVGLPAAERSRLVEPYVTTRAKGSGLGLAIVKKIAEQHGGTLTLGDAAPFGDGEKPGARAELDLPAATGEEEGEDA